MWLVVMETKNEAYHSNQQVTPAFAAWRLTED